MPYIGNQGSIAGFVNQPSKQDLTGATGGTLTLTHAVSGPEDISLFINNVRQEPTESYTVTGTTVTLQGYTVAATDDIYVLYNGLTQLSSVPVDGSVTSAKLGSNIDIAGTLDVTGVLTADSGIKLGAGTDVLSIYDEGTWTPSIGGTATYNAQTGYYTRVGNLVLCIYDIHINVIGTGSTSIMTGFPFTAANLTGGPVSYYAGIATSVYSLDSYIINGSTNMYFTGHTTASVNIGNNLTVFQNGARIVGAVTYRV